MDNPGQDSEGHTVDILVDLGRVGLAVDNQDNVHAADKDHVAADNLDSAAASGLVVVVRPVCQVVPEPGVPGWKQFVQQKTSVEALAVLHDNYPPVVDSEAADEPG